MTRPKPGCIQRFPSTKVQLCHAVASRLSVPEFEVENDLGADLIREMASEWWRGLDRNERET